MASYLIQYDRARRYLERLKMIYEGTFPVHRCFGNLDYFDDEVVSFFIHCYHVKDWIIGYSTEPLTSSEIERFINAHDELKICADFCNGEKHCKLERKTRTGSQPHFFSREQSVTHFSPESGVPSVYQASYTILSGDKHYDALVIAERCIELWDLFISSNNGHR